MAVHVVQQWLVEYACHHGLTVLLHAIGHVTQNTSEENSQAPGGGLMKLVDSEGSHGCHLLEVRLALMYLKTITDSGDINQFDTALEIVMELYNALSTTVPFKTYAKIISGLKILVLFQMRKDRNKTVLSKLTSYFPRSGFKHPLASEDLEQKLGVAQVKFRRFFLRMIINEEAWNYYMMNRHESEFGASFLATLQGLLRRFIQKVEDVMPQTAIDKIMQNPDLAVRLRQQGYPEVEVLLDAVVGKSSLVESEALELYRGVTSHPGQLPGVPTMMDLDTSRPQQLKSPKKRSAPDAAMCEGAELADPSPSEHTPVRKKPRGGHTHSEEAETIEVVCISSSSEEIGSNRTKPDAYVNDVSSSDTKIYGEVRLTSSGDSSESVSLLSPRPDPRVKMLSRNPLRQTMGVEGKLAWPTLRSLLRRTKSLTNPGQEEHHRVDADRFLTNNETLSDQPALRSSPRRLKSPMNPGQEEHHRVDADRFSTNNETLSDQPALRSSPQRLKSPMNPGQEEHHRVDADRFSTNNETLSDQPALRSSPRRLKSPMNPGQEEHHRVDADRFLTNNESLTDQPALRSSPRRLKSPMNRQRVEEIAGQTPSRTEENISSDSESFETCKDDESFSDCLSVVDFQSCGMNNQDLTPLRSRSTTKYARNMDIEDEIRNRHVKDTDHVSDSEGEDSLPIVPSSYSFDKYNVLCGPVGTLVKMSIPKIDVTARPEGVRPCIVKLYHAKDLESVRTGRHKIYC